MKHINGLLAYSLSLATAVATIGIAKLLLRNSVKDTLDLLSALPTRSVKGDKEETRDTNRRNAHREMVCVLVLRSLPGTLLAIFGAYLILLTIGRVLPMISE